MRRMHVLRYLTEFRKVRAVKIILQKLFQFELIRVEEWRVGAAARAEGSGPPAAALPLPPSPLEEGAEHGE